MSFIPLGDDEEKTSFGIRRKIMYQAEAHEIAGIPPFRPCLTIFV